MFKSILARIFLLTSYNLNFDPRERHWVTFVLFSKFVVSLNQHAIPTTAKWFQRCVYSEKNTTYFFFQRITVSVLSGIHIYNGGPQ